MGQQVCIFWLSVLDLLNSSVTALNLSYLIRGLISLID